MSKNNIIWIKAKATMIKTIAIFFGRDNNFIFFNTTVKKQKIRQIHLSL